MFSSQLSDLLFQISIEGCHELFQLLQRGFVELSEKRLIPLQPQFMAFLMGFIQKAARRGQPEKDFLLVAFLLVGFDGMPGQQFFCDLADWAPGYVQMPGDFCHVGLRQVPDGGNGMDLRVTVSIEPDIFRQFGQDFLFFHVPGE